MKICDNGTTREMTASEKQEQEKVYAEAQTRAEAAEAQAVVKANALAKLGLTEAEILALFGK